MSDGPTVVFLHGQPGSGQHWRPVVHRLPAGMRIVAEDRPGYGTNPAPATGLHGNAEFVLGRLDALGAQRAVIVGHSWAGAAAVDLAERHPERVAGLVLISSVGPGAVTLVDRLLAASVVGEAALWTFFQVAGPVIRRKTAALIGDPEPAPGTPHRGTWRTFLLEQRAMVAELDGIVGRLAMVRAPTVVLAGTADRVVPPAIAERLTGAIAGATLRMVPGAGHALPLTDPYDVVRAVVDIATTAGGDHTEPVRARRPAPASAPPPH